MSKNRYPQAALDDVDPEVTQEIVTSLVDLHNMDKPKTDADVRHRIDEYFVLCENSSMRPGIETLCFALHISRTTLFNWCRGVGCSDDRRDAARSVKGFLSAYIEQVMLRGKISPPSGIFLMKNWLGYKDALSLEEAMPHVETRRALTSAELPRLGENLAHKDN